MSAVLKFLLDHAAPFELIDGSPGVLRRQVGLLLMQGIVTEVLFLGTPTPNGAPTRVSPPEVITKDWEFFAMELACDTSANTVPTTIVLTFHCLGTGDPLR